MEAMYCMYVHTLPNKYIQLMYLVTVIIIVIPIYLNTYLVKRDYSLLNNYSTNSTHVFFFFFRFCLWHYRKGASGRTRLRRPKVHPLHLR